MSPVTMGILGGLGAGAATCLGAVGVYSIRELPRRGEDLLLSTAAGIMLAATFFALLAPGIEVALEQEGSAWGAAAVIGGGLLLGVGLLTLADRLLPHEHFQKGREGPAVDTMRRIWLFVIAISLHNIPEGLAVGVGFATGDLQGGLSLAIGIGLQNIPEGLAVAAGLTAIGYGRTRAFLVSMGTGLLEALGAALGAGFAVLSVSLLPWGLAFAGGAMLFVITSEIIPETQRTDSRKEVSLALLGGFVVMMVLDILLR
jgi:ZIP family zinc transporter